MIDIRLRTQVYVNIGRFVARLRSVEKAKVASFLIQEIAIFHFFPVQQLARKISQFCCPAVYRWTWYRSFCWLRVSWLGTDLEMWKSLKQILVFSFTGSHWCYGGECHNIHRAIIHESMSRRFYEPMIHILQNMYNAFTLKIYDHVRISNLIHQQRFPDIYKIWPDWIKRNQHRKHCFMTWNQRTHGRHSLSDTVRLLHILLESQESVISRLVDYIPVPILPMSSCSGSADNIRTRPFETNPAHSLGMTWCAPSKQGTNSTSQEQTKFTNPTCPISHNTPPLTRNVHIFVPRYTVRYGTGAL